MTRPTVFGLFAFLAACGPDPMLVDVRVEPAAVDFSAATLTPSGAEVDLQLYNDAANNAAVMSVALTGEDAWRLLVRDLTSQETLELGTAHDFGLRLTDDSELDEGASASLTITVRGYGGLGDEAILVVPVALTDAPTECDNDGDGAQAPACGGEDCNDDDPLVFPGADEDCNGIDDDCDGQIDEDAGQLDDFFPDLDGDGYGDSGLPVQACVAPGGYVESDGDCDDTNPDVYPGAPEAECDDPIDYNCDGIVGFVDADGDGFAACEDCDDGNGEVFPGAAEVCDGVDNDCDTLVDPPGTPGQATWFPDLDGDGFGDGALGESLCAAPADYVLDGSDCDDTNSDVSPAGVEVCNGTDDDCDGAIDDDAIDAETWYSDADLDGFGDPTLPLISCTPPGDAVENDLDCDDADSSVHPLADEVCDATDNDCDGVVDPDTSIGATDWFADSDGDDFGDPLVSDTACDAPAGFGADNTDCDDTLPTTFPGADELCDGQDNDCDGAVDEDAIGDGDWFADADGDGFGDALISVTGCDPPPGFVLDATDCDDANATVNPDGTELCDGIDNNCDGNSDEGNTPDGTPFYRDSDGDSFGDATDSVRQCAQPAGYVTDDTDCDDDLATVSPAADEACDGIDNNCDGSIDDGTAVDQTTWFADIDGDLHGDPAVSQDACDAPLGFVDVDTDCDDGDAGINPDADDLCDSIDNNCDGDIDEDSPAADAWSRDADNDFFGDSSNQVFSCTRPAGYVRNPNDCDDSDPTINPAGSERCDGVDNDCDGAIDEGWTPDGIRVYDDLDGDGFGATGTAHRRCSVGPGESDNRDDCDDDDADINPDADEVCDSVDNNCDGNVDETTTLSDVWFHDGDGDAHGDPDDSVQTCFPPADYISDNTDCDDNEPDSYPGNTPESCDGLDNDCDGLVDNGFAPDGSFFYRDRDRDTFGDASTRIRRCSQPNLNWVPDNTDCDDDDDAIRPSATEVCDSVDNNCDGAIDEPTAADALTWFADADGDDFGDPASPTPACDQPSGHVADDTDCLDSDASVNPDGTEVCGDGLDNDCNGTTDLLGVDSDGDGFDNCIDATIYDWDFDTAGPGDSTTFGAFGWSVAEFANMTCCGAAPLGFPQPGTPGNPENWQISGGTLTEASNAAHTIAYSPDAGQSYEFDVSADISAAGNNNDVAGIFFNYLNRNNFILVRWDNPEGSYARYSGLSSIDLIRCVGGSCTMLDTTSGGVATAAPGVFNNYTVQVRTNDITVFIDGTPTLSSTLTGAAPLGPGRVGAYAFDTDSGVTYDNFTLTAP